MFFLLLQLVGIISIIIIAISLSIDSFVASLVLGSNTNKTTITKILKVALIFGFFQSLMPLIGWLIGETFKNTIECVDHWIAFFLLFLVGGKMLFECFSKQKNENKTFQISNFLILITLGISTSIDALVVGVTFGILKVEIIIPLIIIGVVTFVFSSIGVVIGKKINGKFGRKFIALGGIVLILLGVKILIEHLYFNI